MFYKNHNFLLHFSVFWYDGHKSSHQSSVFNKILSGWQLDQVSEIHDCIREWLRLHPLSARENFTDFCHCRNFKTYPRVSHCVHPGSPIRKKWRTYHDCKKETPTKVNLHKLEEKLSNWFCVRCDTKWHATEICRCQCPFGGIRSSVYQIKSQRNYVLNSTLPLNYSCERSPWNPLNRGWMGPCTSLDILK